jgi:hypothetical protein
MTTQQFKKGQKVRLVVYRSGFAAGSIFKVANVTPMKHYPSIPSNFNPSWDAETNVVAFDKLDGSNIRAEWSSKRKGFYKFGSRRKLIDVNEPILGKSIDLIVSGFEKKLSERFIAAGYESVVCFFEFYGPLSFAGQHVDSDHHQVALIDIAPYKKGILPPKAFIDLCDDLDTPRVLHVGPIDQSFQDNVMNGTLEGMTFEGVVCKYLSKNGKMTEMFKIKNIAWLNKLKELCGKDEGKFNELR